jgi:hypothetical protein
VPEIVVVPGVLTEGTVGAPGSTPPVGDGEDPEATTTMVTRAATPIAAMPNCRRTESPYAIVGSSTPDACRRKYAPNQGLAVV